MLQVILSISISHGAKSSLVFKIAMRKKSVEKTPWKVKVMFDIFWKDQKFGSLR